MNGYYLLKHTFNTDLAKNDKVLVKKGLVAIQGRLSPVGPCPAQG